MTAPTAAITQAPALDEQAVEALVSILTDLAAFFDDCCGPVADAVNDHFDDLAAADWIPSILADHARVLEAALQARS